MKRRCHPLRGAAAWPLTARAQQAERMRRIGVLMGVPGGKTGCMEVLSRLPGASVSCEAPVVPDPSPLRVPSFPRCAAWAATTSRVTLATAPRYPRRRGYNFSLFLRWFEEFLCALVAELTRLFKTPRPAQN